MLECLIWLTLLTGLPTLELRASIPFGFFAPQCTVFEWWMVALYCTLLNIVVGILAFEILLPILDFIRHRWAWFDKKIWSHIQKHQEKLRPSVERYGEWGLALFIGVPLPGTGAFSGALGAFLLGFKRRNFYLANAVGVLFAGICVTAICLLIEKGAIAEDSWIKKLMVKEVAPTAEVEPAAQTPTESGHAL